MLKQSVYNHDGIVYRPNHTYGTLFLNLLLPVVFLYFGCGLIILCFLVPESQADVEKVIGLLLRDAGDKLNQEVRNNFSSDVETCLNI